MIQHDLLLATNETAQCTNIMLPTSFIDLSSNHHHVRGPHLPDERSLYPSEVDETASP